MLCDPAVMTAAVLRVGIGEISCRIFLSNVTLHFCSFSRNKNSSSTGQSLAQSVTRVPHTDNSKPSPILHVNLLRCENSIIKFTKYSTESLRN